MPSSGFGTTYQAKTGKISFNTSLPTEWTRMFSDEELADPTAISWNGATYDATDPATINGIIETYGVTTNINQASGHWLSGFLDLLNHHNVYIHSGNLGALKTIGPHGVNTVVKKVPVSSSFGYLIIDNVVSAHDTLDVGGQVLTTLRFRLSDGKNNTINLHGASWSFSIIFSLIKEDQYSILKIFISQII